MFLCYIVLFVYILVVFPCTYIITHSQIRKKQRTYNRAKKYNRPSDWKAYKIIQKQVQNALRQQQLKYLTDSLKKDDSSKKSFWRFIKSQKQDSTGISMLQTSTNNVSTAPEIAETLNNQFK